MTNNTPTKISADDEAEDVRLWKVQRDAAAFERLNKAHAPTLKYLVKKHAAGNKMLVDDLAQEAVILFIKLLDSFDASKARLGTYIRRGIDLELRAPARLARGLVQPVRSGGKWQESSTISLTREDGTECDPQEFDGQGSQHITTVNSPGMIAVHTEPGGVSSYGRAVTLDDAIRDSDLSRRERRVLEARHGQHDKASRRELAREFEVSETRVRQIEEAAIRKVESHISEQRADGKESYALITHIRKEYSDAERATL